eukprot:scaffold17327_cov67-Attheya_sp.AAC.9
MGSSTGGRRRFRDGIEEESDIGLGGSHRDEAETCVGIGGSSSCEERQEEDQEVEEALGGKSSGPPEISIRDGNLCPAGTILVLQSKGSESALRDGPRSPQECSS